MRSTQRGFSLLSMLLGLIAIGGALYYVFVMQKSSVDTLDDEGNQAAATPRESMDRVGKKSCQQACGAAARECRALADGASGKAACAKTQAKCEAGC